MASRQIRATLQGFPLWAVEKYARENGMRESTALAAIVQRWLDTEDQGLLSRNGITRQAFKGAEIVQLGRKRKA